MSYDSYDVECELDNTKYEMIILFKFKVHIEEVKGFMS